MKLNRIQLARHLKRLACNGQIKEAVFGPAFFSEAITKDTLLFVVAPELPKGKTLIKEPIGIADLDKFTKALGSLSGEGNEALSVDIKVANNRLVIDEEHRGTIELMTAKPRTISSYVEHDVARALLKKIPKTKGIPITQQLVEGVRSTFALLKVQEVELFVGPKGGRIQVGGEQSDMAKFASEELVADTEYSLLFAEHLIDVLGVVTNFNDATLKLAGPDAPVVIDDGGYLYVLSPKARSQDEQ